MKTLADFKRLQEGTSLTLVNAVGMPNHPWLNKPRIIEKKQTNGIKFEGGSWLYYPSAKEFRIENNIAIIQETDRDGKKYDLLFYKINND